MGKTDNSADGLGAGTPEVDRKKGLKNKQGLQRRYKERFSHIKTAKEAMTNDNLLLCVKKYHEYLKVMADVFDCEPYELNPSFFNRETEITELFLISQVYWELARVYDLTPKLHPQFSDCLKQYVAFTLNMPYQIVNAEQLRKFIKKGQLNSAKAYHDAYGTIHVANKACYIATECFGSEHAVTQDLRVFKKKIAKSLLGLEFIHYYYRFSPLLISYSKKFPLLGNLCKSIIFKPLLRVFAKFSNRFII